RGDLSGPDCSSCVARAMSSWRDLCGGAVAARVQLNGCLALYEISGFPQVSGVQMLFKTCGPSGQVYLDKCYITYSYYP
uniref:Gnk2-homologous domain-containing protein n=1 Tax=Aegilops tauschii subsp. strangulata TaxID=200361 RepID=A0A453J5B8_AEGTS